MTCEATAVPSFLPGTNRIFLMTSIAKLRRASLVVATTSTLLGSTFPSCSTTNRSCTLPATPRSSSGWADCRISLCAWLGDASRGASLNSARLYTTF